MNPQTFRATAIVVTLPLQSRRAETAAAKCCLFHCGRLRKAGPTKAGHTKTAAGKSCSFHRGPLRKAAPTKSAPTTACHYKNRLTKDGPTKPGTHKCDA